MSYGNVGMWESVVCGDKWQVCMCGRVCLFDCGFLTDKTILSKNEAQAN